MKKTDLTGYPRVVRAVRPAEPVGADLVVQPEGVQPDLEGAHVQAAVGAAVRLGVGGGLGEQDRGAAAAGLAQYLKWQ